LLIAFNKPYGVVSQFTPEGLDYRTLAEYGFPKDVYPLGRLDADSEGLLLLSDEPGLNSRLLNPEHGHLRTYWAQVENTPDEGVLRKLQRGVLVQGRRTLPCRTRVLEPQPVIEERDPPIRTRKNIPTCWIELELAEGKNRQVRRMTAAVGCPTLRLIRIKIGNLELAGLKNGCWKELGPGDRKKIFETK
jgi:23S rRNA pseudouridine2457 synthase